MTEALFKSCLGDRAENLNVPGSAKEMFFWLLAQKTISTDIIYTKSTHHPRVYSAQERHYFQYDIVTSPANLPLENIYTLICCICHSNLLKHKKSF